MGLCLARAPSTRPPPRAICAPSNAERNSGYDYDMLPPIYKCPADSKWHIHTLYGQRISHIASQAIFKVVFGCFYYYSWLEYIASRTLAVFKFSSRLLWMAGAHVLCTTHRNWFDPSSPEILTRFGVFGERKKLLCIALACVRRRKTERECEHEWGGEREWAKNTHQRL